MKVLAGFFIVLSEDGRKKSFPKSMENSFLRLHRSGDVCLHL
ncbi:hypothetical protein NXY30_09520 [Bacteroides faecis]|uniref:Uncharacterized protein n=1 Tax=Bacteroides faecis TaxID=674529 RepID=A0ABY5TJJ1_9BACE|nr:hypothetical protein [Bacteroides faecis]UVQ76582.1 hypothetical protein NXY30_09520 [Bacteroides faecis]